MKTPNDVTNAARPSLIRVGTHSIPRSVCDVNGAATDAYRQSVTIHCKGACYFMLSETRKEVKEDKKLLSVSSL